MALPQLTDEQVRTWTREQKDQWWLTKVFRGDMPQLTLRSAITGFFLGGILSATNLYVGAKTGWSLGVGITSVILAFAIFKLFARLGMTDLTILENNSVQSIATSAGYMTAPLVSGLAAFMMIENRALPMYQMFGVLVIFSLMGVLVAFPMKRRFVNDEQQPFPEGRACGVVLDTLYDSDANVGLFKARVLAITAGGAGLLSVISGENIMQWVQQKLFKLKSFWFLHMDLDHYYDRWLKPKIAGVELAKIGFHPVVDLAMIGAGGLMGIRAASSMLLGAVLNFVVIVPTMIHYGEIAPKADGSFSRTHVLNTWSLWWGIAIMVTASMASLFAKPKVILSAFKFTKKPEHAGADALAHLELPFKVSLIGVPILGVIGVWMIHAWFGVRWDLGLLAIPLIVVLTLIAANSTALTGTTPTGSLSKIPQFLFGSLNPRHPPTNLMTALMCTEVASNASNLLMDIKPGYMLGAKPRQQAIGHTIGIFAGAFAAIPLFSVLFLSALKPGVSVEQAMVTDQFAFPAAMQWKGVSELVTAVFSGGGSVIPQSAVYSMIIAAVVGLAMTVAQVASRGRFPLSPLAIGLGVVVPPDSTIAMFAGAFIFWIMSRKHEGRPGTSGHTLWVETQEPICAGLIAGASLIGIADVLVKVFLLS